MEVYIQCSACSQTQSLSFLQNSMAKLILCYFWVNLRDGILGMLLTELALQSSWADNKLMLNFLAYSPKGVHLSHWVNRQYTVIISANASQFIANAHWHCTCLQMGISTEFTVVFRSWARLASNGMYLSFSKGGTPWELLPMWQHTHFRWEAGEKKQCAKAKAQLHICSVWKKHKHSNTNWFVLLNARTAVSCLIISNF